MDTDTHPQPGALKPRAIAMICYLADNWVARLETKGLSVDTQL